MAFWLYRHTVSPLHGHLSYQLWKIFFRTSHTQDSQMSQVNPNLVGWCFFRSWSNRVNFCVKLMLQVPHWYFLSASVSSGGHFLECFVRIYFRENSLKQFSHLCFESSVTAWSLAWSLTWRIRSPFHLNFWSQAPHLFSKLSTSEKSALMKQPGCVSFRWRFKLLTLAKVLMQRRHLNDALF